ncbi:hypothetical protein LCM4576_23585 [Mesorhizobium sp. LCM 4576]|uniref:hypothetical protein n=1 Tax=Mesorhizobium sp. LCM 4576 TaxID=1848289 RepID=UPI0008D9DF25|nr:hypothetical protein [Mesorhizobium sp. LCM 4576]OHV67902.1 hypothetical protein LCM4576_23585 [Mesorhizobium sp. LCM 4576]
MSLTVEKAAIDTAWATLQTAVGAYLSAGGSPWSAAFWLLAQVANIDPRIAKVCDGQADKAISARQNRATTFAAMNERPK